MGVGTLLIRADASPEIGAGHVMRCLALAQAWQDAGGDAIFIMAQYTPAIRARLIAENCAALPIGVIPGSALDLALTKEAAQRYAADWVVLDGYRFDARCQEELKSVGQKLLFVDDMGDCEYYVADIVLNQNLNACDEWYRRRGSETQLLVGSRFCLLRREFAKWRKWKRDIPPVARRVFVTLGGSAPAPVATTILEAVDLAQTEGMNGVFVVGAPDLDSIERYSAQSQKLTIQKDVSNMAALMSESDIAISAAGSTCWELCLLGLPSVLLDVAPNQTPVALELKRRGCAVYAGHGEDFSASELANILDTLAVSANLRESLSRRARQVVDGHGAERVVSAMQGINQSSELLVARGART